MNLNKENLKKIRGLIVFTVILLIALWNYSLILDVLGQGVGIVYPFLLGGAIAFVINVPMSFFEAGGHFYIDRERNTVIYAESAELGRRDFP